MTDEPERARTMAELKADVESERARALDAGETPAYEGIREARPNIRDDELLDDPPRGTHHLGRFAGWQQGNRVRWIVAGTLGVGVLAGLVAVWQYHREVQERRMHPLPEVEALIRPGTPRDMTLSEGRFRVGLSREPPAVNVLHLPDRDITLARRADKAQFKVEVRDGKTIKLKVLTGAIEETLTTDDAVPLLD